MKYDETGLPEKVKAYLEDIYNDRGLSDAFFDCDVEILDEACITDMEDDCSWLDDLMGPSQSRESFYEDIKPFAMDGTGAVWVILNDELVGYIGTEGGKAIGKVLSTNTTLTVLYLSGGKEHNKKEIIVN